MSLISEAFAEIVLNNEMGVETEVKKTAVTARLTDSDLWRLDFVAKKIGYSRSAAAQVILEDGILEAAAGLGFDLVELQALQVSEQTGKSIEECRDMLSKTGIFFTANKEAK